MARPIPPMAVGERVTAIDPRINRLAPAVVIATGRQVRIRYADGATRTLPRRHVDIREASE